tara:strand:+ start:108 stop:632 length:525 start_codon:yes stop_codon:yes gene_type:complete
MGRTRAQRLEAVEPGDDTRRCSRCELHYPATAAYFGPGPNRDGFASACRNCQRESRRRSYTKGGGSKQARKYTQSKAGKYQAYRNGAKQRGLSWDLSRWRFEKLWRQPCHYCGAEISTIGIDRIDSSQGYHASNIVSCCAECNIAKMSRTSADYIAHCRRVADHSRTIAKEVKS